MIEARGLVKHYRSTPAIDNLSFDVCPEHRDRLPWPERPPRPRHSVYWSGTGQVAITNILITAHGQTSQLAGCAESAIRAALCLVFQGRGAGSYGATVGGRLAWPSQRPAGTGEYYTAGSVRIRRHPRDMDVTGLSPVMKTTQTRRRTTAHGR